MIRRPPRATRTDTLFPYTTLFRARTGARAGRPRATLGRSCAPPLLPPVRLHVAERTPLVATHAQVELLDVLVLPQLGGRSVADHAAGIHHVAAGADRHRHARVRTHEQAAGPGAHDVDDDTADFITPPGSEAR